MLTWLTENLATILICAVLIGVVTAVIVSMIRAKKQGKSSCGCGCGSCPMSGACHDHDHHDRDHDHSKHEPKNRENRGGENHLP